MSIPTNPGESRTFIIDPDLSYVPGQSAIIVIDVNNFFHGEIQTYNTITGQMTVIATDIMGSGTY